MNNNQINCDLKERSKEQEFFDKMNGKAFTVKNETYLIKGYEVNSRRFIVDIYDPHKRITTNDCTLTLDFIKNLIIESFLEKEEYEDYTSVYPETWDKLKKAFKKLCTFQGSVDELSSAFNYIWRNSVGWGCIIRYIRDNPKMNMRYLFESLTEDSDNPKQERGNLMNNNQTQENLDAIKEKFCRKMFDKRFMFENRRYTVLNYDFDRDLFVISKEIFGPKPGTADIIYTIMEREELEKMVEGVQFLGSSN